MKNKEQNWLDVTWNGKNVLLGNQLMATTFFRGRLGGTSLNEPGQIFTDRFPHSEIEVCEVSYNKKIWRQPLLVQVAYHETDHDKVDSICFYTFNGEFLFAAEYAPATADEHQINLRHRPELTKKWRESPEFRDWQSHIATFEKERDDLSARLRQIDEDIEIFNRYESRRDYMRALAEKLKR